MENDSVDDLIGHFLGRYRIIARLDEGGMAVIYKAQDPRLGREVAIKVIKRDAFEPDQIGTILRRFDREAKMLAALNHPNIVKVLDYGEQEGMPYLVMECFSRSLKTLLKMREGKPFSWWEAAKMLAPIARALDAAHKHEEGIVHRDVKPSNILLDKNGIPMLADFGIAGSPAFNRSATGVGIGTPAYMAPEQWTGHALDHRVDIYALGVVFFEMVTGQMPFKADTPIAMMMKKTKEPPPSPAAFAPGIPKEVEFVLFKSLAGNPADRYVDMAALAGILEEMADGILPRISSPVTPNPAESTRAPLMIAGGICLTLLLALLGWATMRPLLFNSSNPPSATAPPAEPTPLPPANTNPALLPDPTNVAPVNTELPPPATGDQAELVFIPAGEFLMGSDPGEPYFWGAEAPKHTVYLDAFWIYRTEVTNGMYRACVEVGACLVPRENSSHTHEEYFNSHQYDGYPVIHVGYEDAAAYCEWAGARLPTEAEWEKAARGTEGVLFPWGSEELQDEFANFCDEGCPEHSIEFTEQGFNDGYRDVAPVGSYPAGASPFGALDMAGNVLEWVADWYAVDYYSHSPEINPTGPESGTRRIIRGGSWWSLREGLRPAARASKSPEFSSDMVGFRCAVDAP